MDSIKYILKFIFKLVMVLLLAWFVLFSVSIFFPALSVKSLLSLGNSSTTTPMADDSWLPAPGSWGGLFGKTKTPGTNNIYAQTDNIFVQGPVYNQNGKTYDNQGSNSNDQQQATSTQAPISNVYSPKSLFIRNLSIYEGGHVYTGLSFVGDARDTMFKDGKFPIIIVDQTGRAVSVSYAEATTNWSVPGWVRFQVKINSVLPNKVPCTMVFESAQRTYSNANQQLQPTRVSIPVLCN